jgi:large subunit ribosomal protein L15
MQLNELQRTHKNKTAKRVARGGKRGKTAGRGTKGQKARAGHRLRPEMRDIIKKYPKLRGRGKHMNKAFRIKATPVNFAVLEKVFVTGDVVTPEILFAKKAIKKFGGRIPSVKILATGTLTKKLQISGCLLSRTAQGAIEALGGTVATAE